MGETDGYTVSALKSLTEPHRLEWFGKIYRGAATTVDAVFSPWGVNPDTGEMLSGKGKQRSIQLPIAFLRLFRIGSIWQNGSLSRKFDHQAREVFHLDIQEGSVKVAPAGAPLNDDSRAPVYPLPFASFTGHLDHTHAYCARIDLDEQTILLIPCMELVRFYFGASGSFLKRLFSGPFALDRLATYSRLDRMSGKAVIDLADDLAAPAAATIARIVFDSQARSAASWIVNSGTAAAANKQPYYPKTTFPFFGETDLTADGRWFAEGGYRIFLAEQIQSCTHPFPFETLFYTTHRHSLKSQNICKPASIEDNAQDDAPSVDVQLDETQGSTLLSPIEVSCGEQIDEPFPDLAMKKIRRVKNPKPFSAPPSPPEMPAELGSGDELSTSEDRSAEVAPEAEIGTIDESAMGLMPPDAAAVFNEGFKVFSFNGKRPFRLVPAFPEIQSDSDSNRLYQRADVIGAGDDKLLENVWCTVIQVDGPPVEKVLVLIRDNVTHDMDDHIAMVRLVDKSNPREEIEACCREFAHGPLPNARRKHLLLLRHSDLVTNSLSMIRGLSMMLSRLWQGDREPDTPLPILAGKSLEEPLFSSAELEQLLQRARR